MTRHLYLRAYMAAIVVPSIWLLLVLAGFCVARFVYQVAIPIERFLPFPMALVPTAFGLWNILYVKLHSHWHHSIGLHGMALPLFLGPTGFVVAAATGVARVADGGLVYFDLVRVPYWYLPIGPFAALAVYYLIWKYLVGYCNRALDLPS
jgi:hypothetical protein